MKCCCAPRAILHVKTDICREYCIMYRAVLLDAYVLRPESSRPVVVSSTHTVYSAINLSRKSLRVFTSNSIRVNHDLIRVPLMSSNYKCETNKKLSN